MVKGYAGDDQGDAGEVFEGADLSADDEADDGGGGREEGEHEGDGGSGQPGHGELVGDVGDDRGAQPDADTPGDSEGVGERGGGDDADRGGDDGGDEHGQSQLIDAAHRGRGMVGAIRGGVGDAVAEHDVEHEPDAVGEGEHEPQRLAGEPDFGEDDHTADRSSAHLSASFGEAGLRRPRRTRLASSHQRSYSHLTTLCS